MSEQVISVMTDFFKLSEKERAVCWDALCEKVSDQDDELFDELERRRQEFESGRDPGVPMDEVFEKLLGTES